VTDDAAEPVPTCANCGAELLADARFCAQCGAPVHDDGAPGESPTVVIEPEPEEVLPETQVVEPVPAAVDSTTTGVAPSPALQRVIDTPPRPPREPKPPRERRPLEERGTFEEFLGAVAPLLRAPRFAGNLLGALVAIAWSMAIAAVAGVGLDRVGDSTLGLLPVVNYDDDQFGAITLLALTFHQVPLVNEDVVRSAAPLLLVAIPIIGCAIGLTIARRTVPESGRVGGFLARIAPFAILYGLGCLVWSAVGADDWHAAHASSFFAGLVIAAIGAWVAERRIGLHPDLLDGDEHAREQVRSRPGRAIRTGVRVFALLVAVASLGWLAGTILTQVRTLDDGTGEAVAESVLHVVEGGFEAVGFGVLAEGTPFGTIDDDHAWRVWELGDVLPDSAVVVSSIVAFAAVLIGGLFSGFAMARAAEPRSRNDHALYGALTGLVWAVLLLLAQQLVLIWEVVDEDRLTAMDGTQVVGFGLLVGGVLGAIGGLLAAGPRESGALEAAAEAVAPDDDEREADDPGTAPA
jgi:hypothetical protein